MQAQYKLRPLIQSLPQTFVSRSLIETARDYRGLERFAANFAKTALSQPTRPDGVSLNTKPIKQA